MTPVPASPVVPDEPALALPVRCIECGITGTHRVCADCFVAATDDEAEVVIALALKAQGHGDHIETTGAAITAVAALRSAGFRIVHDNTEAPR